MTGGGFGNWAVTQVAFCLNQGGGYIDLIWISIMGGNGRGVQQWTSGLL